MTQVVNVAGHMTVDVRTEGFAELAERSSGAVGELIAKPRAPLAIDACQPADDYSDQVILLGRLKPGTTGESRRVVHVFQLVPGLQHDPVVTPRCGAPQPASDMQWLPGLTGMPCERCVAAR